VYVSSGCQSRVKRYLLNNSQSSKVDEFKSRLDELGKDLKSEPRHQINGHDFLRLLRWFLRPIVRERKPLADERVFERAVIACVELELLDQHALFQQIVARIAQ
jgi:hypothetical protein